MKVTAYRNNRCFGSYIYEVPRLHLPHFKTDLHNILPGKPCVATRHNITSPSHLVEVEVPCFGLYKSTEHNPAIGRGRSESLPICVQTPYLPLLESTSASSTSLGEVRWGLLIDCWTWKDTRLEYRKRKSSKWVTVMYHVTTRKFVANDKWASQYLLISIPS